MGPVAIIAPLAFQSAVAGISHFLSGPATGSDKTNATAIVQSTEAYMVQNLEDFQDARISRTEALSRYDQLWAAMTGPEALMHPSMNDATTAHFPQGVGVRSIAERNRGGVYDYFRRYRDPIEQSPLGLDDPILSAILPEPIAGFLSSNLIWIGGACLLVLFLVRK